jgi:hypothetical protein
VDGDAGGDAGRRVSAGALSNKLEATLRTAGVAPDVASFNSGVRSVAVLAELADKPDMLAERCAAVLAAGPDDPKRAVQAAIGAKLCAAAPTGAIAVGGDLGRLDAVHVLLAPDMAHRASIISLAGVDAGGAAQVVATPPLPSARVQGRPVLPLADGVVQYGDEFKACALFNAFPSLPAAVHAVGGALAAVGDGGRVVVGGTVAQQETMKAACLLFMLKEVATMDVAYVYVAGDDIGAPAERVDKEEEDGPDDEDAPPPVAKPPAASSSSPSKAAGTVIILTRTGTVDPSVVDALSTDDISETLVLAPVPAAQIEALGAAASVVGFDMDAHHLAFLAKQAAAGTTGLELSLVKERLRKRLAPIVKRRFAKYDAAAAGAGLQSASYLLHTQSNCTPEERACNVAAGRVDLMASGREGEGAGFLADAMTAAARKEQPGDVQQALNATGQAGLSFLHSATTLYNRTTAGAHAMELDALHSVGMRGAVQLHDGEAKRAAAVKFYKDLLNEFCRDSKEQVDYLLQSGFEGDREAAADEIRQRASPLADLTGVHDLLLAVRNDSPAHLHDLCDAYIKEIKTGLDDIQNGRSTRVADADKAFSDAFDGMDDPTLRLFATYVKAVVMRTHDDLPPFEGLRAEDIKGKLMDVAGLYIFVAWHATKVGVSFQLWRRICGQLAVRDRLGRRVAHHKHAFVICVYPDTGPLRGVPFACLLDALESTAVTGVARVRPNHGVGRPGLSAVGAPRTPPLRETALLEGGRDVIGLLMVGDAPDRRHVAVLAVQDGPRNLRLINPPSWIGSPVVQGARVATDKWVPAKKEAGRVLAVFFTACWVTEPPKPAFDASRFCGAALVAKAAIDAMAQEDPEGLKTFLAGTGASFSREAHKAANDALTQASRAKLSAELQAIEEGAEAAAAAEAAPYPADAAAAICAASARAVKEEARRQGMDTLDKQVKLYAYALAAAAASGMKVGVTVMTPNGVWIQ